MSWVRAASLNDLLQKPVVFKHALLQIALFRTNGRVYAVDNRCPHEGYPLALGTVNSDCVLTCNWHNWKFQLEDGRCIIGGDNVRSYPTRLEGDEVWVDVSAPPQEEIRGTIMTGLRKAFADRDYGRICREIARLQFHRFDPKDAIRAAILWSYNRYEPGSAEGHAYAGAADWITLANTFENDFERRLICFAEPVDHMALDTLRQAEFPYAPPGSPFKRDDFLELIEREDLPHSEGMVARALQEGMHWSDLEEAFAAAALSHYRDFGHSVIYVSKTGELLSHLGDALEPCLLPLQTRLLCYASRDDLIPEFKEYAPMLRALHEPRVSTTIVSDDLEVPFPCTLKQAFHWLSDALVNHDVATVYNALLQALARNLLYYDTKFGTSFDRTVGDSASWLGFTHGLTFSSAARILCSKYPHLWKPALLQMACFLGRNSRYVDPQIDAAAWSVPDASAFLANVHEGLLDHGVGEPIFSVHLLKTTLAVEAELSRATPACRQVLLASLNRFLHSPMKAKHIRRLARQAIALVSRDFGS